MGVLDWAAAWCSRRRPLFIICSLCVCVCVRVGCLIYFFKFFLFSVPLQKKAEAAHRILEGLGPQVELVSWGTGWGALGGGG